MRRPGSPLRQVSSIADRPLMRASTQLRHAKPTNDRRPKTQEGGVLAVRQTDPLCDVFVTRRRTWRSGAPQCRLKRFLRTRRFSITTERKRLRLEPRSNGLGKVPVHDGPKVRL